MQTQKPFRPDRSLNATTVAEAAECMIKKLSFVELRRQRTPVEDKLVRLCEFLSQSDHIKQDFIGWISDDSKDEEDLVICKTPFFRSLLRKHESVPVSYGVTMTK